MPRQRRRPPFGAEGRDRDIGVLRLFVGEGGVLLHRSVQARKRKSNCGGAGFSTHRAPSLSKVAMRSTRSMWFGPSAVRSLDEVEALGLVDPSRQLRQVVGHLLISPDRQRQAPRTSRQPALINHVSITDGGLFSLGPKSAGVPSAISTQGPANQADSVCQWDRR